MHPIAITGIGCRFPGGIHSPETFWRLLEEGRDAVTEVPPDRWDLERHFRPREAGSRKIYTRRGGFLESIDTFDPHFFGISPREAAYLDPQQRLLLEVTWEALEDAGLPPEDLRGAPVGVFVGLFTHDYENLHMGPGELPLYGPHSATGMSTTIAANRISYLYDFTGPSMVVDTACSSSLVAVELACQRLSSGECQAAVAGGVNVLLKPEMTMSLCAASMLSPDGRCKSFDARANGYVRAEGAGMVTLEPLHLALRRGARIHAVIRGIAVNQDGRGEGLTVPNGSAQQAVIHRALDMAGLAPREVRYVEAHGTGTAVGDPIEAQALGSALSQGRPCAEALVIGSVKSNIGHTESAAGVAGLIKTALMLEHRRIPPNLHFETPNPGIPFDTLGLRVATACEPFPGAADAPLVAGVNSFGFGGTNAHVVLESAPPAASLPAVDGVGRLELLPLSGRSPDALRARARQLQEIARQPEPPAVASLARQLGRHRGHHVHRLALLADGHASLDEAIEAFLSDEPSASLQMGSASAKPTGLAFVFGGMGQQWWAMGRELLEREPVFADMVRRCDTQFRRLDPELSVLETLRADEADSPIEQTRIAQPCIFTVQLGLDALWRSWGVRPDAVVGHSQGEVAAGYSAGALSFEDAVCVSYHRSRLQHRLEGRGRMLAVGLSPAEADGITSIYQDEIAIGAVNSASGVTLSGTTQALEAVAEALEARGTFARFLRVAVPYHSPVMDHIRDELIRSLEGLRPRPSTIPMISTVTGAPIEGGTIDAAYWWRNVRETVCFARAVGTLIDRGCERFIELGAHPVLSSSVRECLQAAGLQGLVLPSLRRGEPERERMLRSLGQLYCAGHPLDWAHLYPGRRAPVALPPYPWQRQRHWTESSASRLHRIGSGEGGAAPHPLLGDPGFSPEPGWRALIDPAAPSLGYLMDHQVQGAVVFPAAGYLELALAAASTLDRGGALEDVEILAPLVLQPGRDSRLRLDTAANGGFTIHGRAEAATRWTQHMRGQLAPDLGLQPPSRDLDALRARCGRSVSPEAFYRRMEQVELSYGPAFRANRQIGLGEGEILARLELDVSLHGAVDRYRVHPALLDSAFQLGILLVEGAFLPVGVRRLRLHSQPGVACWAHCRLLQNDGELFIGDAELLEEQGRVLVEVSGLACRRVGARTRGPAEFLVQHSYDFEWQLDLRQGPGRELEPVLDALTEALEERWIELQRRHERRRFYDEVKPALDEATIGFVLWGLGRLGLELEEGERITERSLERRAGVAPKHRLLWRRLLELLAERGYLERARRGWWVLRPLGACDPYPQWRRALAEHPECVTELMLIERCGEALDRVLRDEEAPLGLITPEGAGSMLTEHFYQDSPTCKPYIHAVQEALRALLERLPAERPLRILEVGGGFGGLTGHLLPILPPTRTEYVFTDVSTVFTEQARRRFAGYDFVQYRPFDLERDLVAQGIAPGSFDLVLAFDVVHATADVRRSLGALRETLRPGGLLALIELTSPFIWLDMVFGMLPGWWAFTDLELRRRHPLLPLEGWRAALQDCGFARSVGIGDRVEGHESLHHVILAEAPRVAPAAAAERTPPGAPERGVLILADEHGYAERVASLLESRGARALLARHGAAFHPSEGDRVVLDLDDPEQLAELLDFARRRLGAELELLDLAGLEVGEQQLSFALLEEQPVHRLARTARLVQTVVARGWERTPRLWLVTNGSQAVPATSEAAARQRLAQAPLWGFGRVVMNEHAALHTRLLDLSREPDELELSALCDELARESEEDEIALRGARRYLHRAVRSTGRAPWGSDRTPFRLKQGAGSSPEALRFVGQTRREPGPDQVELEVMAGGLSFKDLAVATGLVDDHSGAVSHELGREGAGVVVRVGAQVEHLRPGDRVAGLVTGAFDSHTLTEAAFLHPIPEALSFAEAATLPVCFITAAYALERLARLQPGERVLIHTATSGVGMAALQIAQAAGAEIYATAGDPVKRQLLRALGVAWVGDSRSTLFAERILEHSGGQGVDVVLNTLPQAAIQRNLAVLRPVTGRLVELSNVHAHADLDLSRTRRGVALYAFDLESISKDRPDLIGALWAELLARFEGGELRPLPHRERSLAQLPTILRDMGKARNIGKTVVDSTEAVIAPPRGVGHRRFEAEATWLVSGGLGGFGLAMARWMVQRGARHLVLTSRGGASNKEKRAALEALRAEGATVLAPRCDVADPAQVDALMAEIARSLPPLRGVFHAAMVLDDRPVVELDEASLRVVLEPKILGAWNLHRATEALPLELFVCFSSFTAFVGNVSQANYAAANRFLDQLAGWRRARGLPGLTIGWGAIGGAGYVAQRDEIRSNFERQGVSEIELEQAWAAIERGLEEGAGYLTVSPVDWRKVGRFLPLVAGSPRFSLLREPVREGEREREEDLALPADPSERKERLIRILSREIAQITGVSTRGYDVERPLVEMGFDSLMAVELAVALGRHTQAEIPKMALLQAEMTTLGLVELVQNLSEAQA